MRDLTVLSSPSPSPTPLRWSSLFMFNQGSLSPLPTDLLMITLSTLSVPSIASEITLLPRVSQGILLSMYTLFASISRTGEIFTPPPPFWLRLPCVRACVCGDGGGTGGCEGE